MAPPAKVSLQHPPGKPGPGHFRSSDQPETRLANDRFESTAAIGRRPLEGAHPPKRSLKGRRRFRRPMRAVRPQFDQPNWNCRPKGVRGDFLVDRPVHFGNGRSPNSSSKFEFGDSSRSQAPPGDRDTNSVERLHSKVANWRARPIVATTGSAIWFRKVVVRRSYLVDESANQAVAPAQPVTA